jgi:hypothetical protein
MRHDDAQSVDDEPFERGRLPRWDILRQRGEAERGAFKCTLPAFPSKYGWQRTPAEMYSAQYQVVLSWFLLFRYTAQIRCN